MMKMKQSAMSLIILFLCFIYTQQQQPLPILEYDDAVLTEQQRSVLLMASEGDASALNTIGTALMQPSSTFGEKNVESALEYFVAAANAGSITALVNIGNVFAEGDGLEQPLSQEAFRWYAAAGEGGHQGALYNCGLLLYQGSVAANDGAPLTTDTLSALEYFQRAFHCSHPDAPQQQFVSPGTTEAAYVAHRALSKVVSAQSIFGKEKMLRLWRAASLQHIPPAADALWHEGVAAIIEFDELFRATAGAIDDQVLHIMEMVFFHLHRLIDEYEAQLSELQIHLILDHLQDVLGPLAGKRDDFIEPAARYTEKYAFSVFCYERSAQWESESACFNGAASSAVSLYRRANLSSDALRVLLTAQKNPAASTNWRLLTQTPRVYHPELRAAPWWNSTQFSLASHLSDLFKDKYDIIQQELDQMIALQEGTLRDVRAPDIEEMRRLQNTASDSLENNSKDNGLMRVFTPNIGVRSERIETEVSGAGAWAEFGPLFDGIAWNADRCRVLPTICKALEQHMKHSTEICGSFVNITINKMNTVDLDFNQRQELNKRVVEEQCGADTVVTLLRLKPGSHILPHCGTTNRRLIMHFVLRGAQGIEFRVGDGTVENAVSQTTVDSFGQNTFTEATSKSGGPFDGFFVQSDMNYMPAMGFTASQAPEALKSKRKARDIFGVASRFLHIFGRKKSESIVSTSIHSDLGNSKDEWNARDGGWVYNYGGDGENGRAIVFDDSFEHEVRHNGNEDRFVLLIVLNHPDVKYK